MNLTDLTPCNNTEDILYLNRFLDSHADKWENAVFDELTSIIKIIASGISYNILFSRNIETVTFTASSYNKSDFLPTINAILIFNSQIDIAPCDVKLPTLSLSDGIHETIKNYELDQFIATVIPAPTDSTSVDLCLEFEKYNLYGKSKPFINLIKDIKKLSGYDASILIEGETGTGKENTARALHYLSSRKNNAFIPVNCAAIPENLIESELFGHKKGAFTSADQSQKGLIEIAEEGTLFLDEIDSLSPKAQAVLLRFLQTGEYHPIGCPKPRTSDVHVIAATNKDLKQQVADGEFREDLYFRLNVLTLQLPPLRGRLEDIKIIADKVIDGYRKKYNKKSHMSQEYMQWLFNQKWPGNVRELENTLLRNFLLCDTSTIRTEDSSGDINQGENTENKEHKSEDSYDRGTLTFKAEKEAVIHKFEKEYLHRVLTLTDGNISAAARIAGKERRAFGKLVKKHELEKEEFMQLA